MILGEQGELPSSLGWSATDGEGREAVDTVRDCPNIYRGRFIFTLCFHREHYELYCIIVNYTHNLTRPNPLVYLMTPFFPPAQLIDWLKTHMVDQDIQSLRECPSGIHHDPGLATCNLMCRIPGGHKEMDTTEQLNNNNRWTRKCLFS